VERGSVGTVFRSKLGLYYSAFQDGAIFTSTVSQRHKNLQKNVLDKFLPFREEMDFEISLPTHYHLLIYIFGKKLPTDTA